MISDLDRGQQRIRELEAILKQNIAQQKRVDTLVEMAWELRMSQPEQAYAISEKSSRLSQSGEFESRHYIRGLAGSLINMAFVETYAGKLDGAVPKCLDAINLLHQESSFATGADVWYTLSWNSFSWVILHLPWSMGPRL